MKKPDWLLLKITWDVLMYSAQDTLESAKWSFSGSHFFMLFSICYNGGWGLVLRGIICEKKLRCANLTAKSRTKLFLVGCEISFMLMLYPFFCFDSLHFASFSVSVIISCWHLSIILYMTNITYIHIGLLVYCHCWLVIVQWYHVPCSWFLN